MRPELTAPCQSPATAERARATSAATHRGVGQHSSGHFRPTVCHAATSENPSVVGVGRARDEAAEHRLDRKAAGSGELTTPSGRRASSHFSPPATDCPKLSQTSWRPSQETQNPLRETYPTRTCCFDSDRLPAA